MISKKVERALRQANALGGQREPKKEMKQCPYKRKHSN